MSTLQQPADIPEEHPPTEWARLAITAYATHGADRIAMADANCTNPRCDGAPAITVVQPAANIALSGARATRDARDASAFGALVSPYEKFESISLQQRDGMGQAARKWHHRRCSQLMECPDAPAERLEQVPRRPGPR